jgi:hypothetical protein
MKRQAPSSRPSTREKSRGSRPAGVIEPGAGRGPHEPQAKVADRPQP